MTTPDERDIVHIATRDEWEAARRSGLIAPASLTGEGFVHCSTRAQVASTLARFFAGRGDLVLLTLDAAAVATDLRWEESHPGEPPFPHVYGPIPVAAVVAVERVRSPA